MSIASSPNRSEQHADLRALIDQTPVGIVVLNMEGVVIDVNAAAVAILGAPDREAVLGLNVLVRSEHIGRGVRAMFRHVLETGEVFEIETPYRSPWGKQVFLRSRAGPRFDADGRQIGAVQILEDISEQKRVKDHLVQQLRYERALELATRTLLQRPRDEAHQREILNQALAFLQEATQVGRVYIFRNVHDDELGECISIVAEACRPGVPSSLYHPANYRWPWSAMPEAMYQALRAGKPFGGDVEAVFADVPDTLEGLRSANVFSVQLFPIFFSDKWWGFVGFDAVESVRRWSQDEIHLLQAMADIFGSTLQRWQAEQDLKRERDILEQRVQERTASLERRLRIERVLATTAARLMTREDFATAIEQSLQDVGDMLDARRVLLARIDVENQRLLAAYEWRAPDIPGSLMTTDDSSNWFQRHLRHLLSRKPLYITDSETQLEENDAVRQLLRERGVRAMILYPQIVDGQVVGVFNISLRRPLTDEGGDEIIDMLDVIANLLNGLLQRQMLIERRDRQILEQTRALSAMLDAAMLDTSARSLSDVVRPILALIADLSLAQTLAVYGLQADGRYAKIADFGEAGANGSWSASFRPSSRVSRWFAQHVEPLLLNPDQLTALTPFSLADGRAGVGMIVNIRAWRHFEGLLLCYRPGEEQYSPNQVAMTTALADYMSMAIENYLLRETAEDAAIIEERQRLARDLHDSVSQSLYGVMLFARAARDALEGRDFGALDVDLARVEENALRALKEMRLLLYQLQPLAFERGGLEQALAHRFEQVEGRLGIETELSVEPSLDLPPDVGESLYRLASEALNNALKHAEASRVSVHLARDGDAILLTVTDNGRGFDPAQVSQTGMGLTNMRYRAENVGGELFIDSAPGQGAVIRCRIPLHRP